ncbi:MAG: hypothetical protein Q4B65_02055 [Candidatus Saccharibacteria bacterium]|nr:hypothetical protein [Candidatus Saccharibacteria bacterium]
MVEKVDKSKKEVREYLNRGSTVENRDRYRKYRATKKRVFELEAVNRKHLYFFPASDFETNKKKFYIVGGASAIILTQELAPRMKIKKQLRRDNDLGDYKFYNGVCSTSDIESLAKKLAEIGVKREKGEDEDGLIIFKLAREYEKAEVREMLKRSELELEKLNQLVYPEIVFPDVHKLALKLKREIPPKMSKLPVYYRDTFGRDFYRALSDLTNAYVFLTRGHFTREEAGDKIILSIDKMLNIVSSLNEIRAWEISTCARISALLVDLQALVKGKILKDEGR